MKMNEQGLPILSMEKSKKEKKKLSPKQIINIILDVILFPILIFAAFFSLSLLITRATKGVPMVFGYAMINIVSGSMQDAGFPIGSTAFIKASSAEDYEVGDYIAFFDYVDPNCSKPPTVANGVKPTSDPNTTRIVFHEIVQVEIDANGERWFHTKGTNNASEDLNIIYQSYVIGQHTEGGFVVSVMSFVTSITGIMVMIVLPCTIILFRDCFELINMAFAYHDERKKKKAEKLASTSENGEGVEKKD